MVLPTRVGAQSEVSPMRGEPIAMRRLGATHLRVTRSALVSVLVSVVPSRQRSTTVQPALGFRLLPLTAVPSNALATNC